MQTKKMSLSNIQGKLSRAEMKNIMAGFDPIQADGEGGCKEKRALCSKSEECCGMLACTNNDGEAGKFRCNGI